MTVEPREEAVHNAARAMLGVDSTQDWDEHALVALRAEPLAALTTDDIGDALSTWEVWNDGRKPAPRWVEALRAELQRREDPDGSR